MNKLDTDTVRGVNQLRQDLGILEGVIGRFRNGNISTIEGEIESLNALYAERGWDNSWYNPPERLVISMRREYYVEIEKLMILSKVALYPLASSRRGGQGQPAPIEYGGEGGEGATTPGGDPVGLWALGAVSGTKVAEKSEEMNR
jgi:hypothetical protein